jgi:hypothetical protein
MKKGRELTLIGHHKGRTILDEYLKKEQVSEYTVEHLYAARKIEVHMGKILIRMKKRKGMSR